jgi:DNA-binding MarR family transcriptional regulator
MRRPDSHLSVLFELFATQQRVRTLLLGAMAGAALTPDDYAVYSVLFDEGPQTPSDLARRVGMPPTTMSHYVSALTGRGHAVRRIVPADRRSYRLALTDAGLRAHADASRTFAEADHRFIAALAMGEDDARDALRAIGEAASSAAASLADDTMAISA